MALTRLGLNQAVNLATNTTGTLAVANGGTGLTSGFVNGTTNVGKVLQTTSANTTSTTVSSSSSYSAFGNGMDLTLTPSSTSNYFLIIFSTNFDFKDDLLTQTGELGNRYRENHVLNRTPFLNTEFL